jgi:hypothetical protein
VAWNCRSGFHRKVEALRTLAPDVAVVAECCDLESLRTRTDRLTATSALWVGDNPNKGLGVFAFGPLRLVRDDGYEPTITYALPVRVESTTSGQTAFHLLAVWAHHALLRSMLGAVGARPDRGHERHGDDARQQHHVVLT